MRGIQLKMSQTDDYEALKKLYIENDLEVDPDMPMPEEVIKNWRITHGAEEHLAAGLTLATRQGEYIIDGIAVEPEYRKMKLGKIILEKAVAEVKKLGGHRIFLVARAPEFFRKQGFVTVAKEDAPEFFECLTCPQYGIKCHPEVMKLEI
ncbi:MAG: GNAT family N-acetyltransferase [Aminipila sp.]